MTWQPALSLPGTSRNPIFSALGEMVAGREEEGGGEGERKRRRRRRRRRG